LQKHSLASSISIAIAERRGDNLLQRHRSSLSQCRREGFFAELGAGDSYGPLVVDLLA
jgi:hypothetical protein